MIVIRIGRARSKSGEILDRNAIKDINGQIRERRKDFEDPYFLL